MTRLPTLRVVRGHQAGHHHEYALPTDTSGTLTLNGRAEKVRGQSWVDRQWAPSTISPRAAAPGPA